MSSVLYCQEGYEDYDGLWEEKTPDELAEFEAYEKWLEYYICMEREDC